MPESGRWIEILKQIGAFEPDSELMRDTALRDCYEFFKTAGQMLGFENEFKVEFEKS